jgi:hypothetical protein
MGFRVRRLLGTGHKRLTQVSVQAEPAVRMGGPVEGVGWKFANLCATASSGSPRSYAVGTLHCLPERPKLILLTPPKSIFDGGLGAKAFTLVVAGFTGVLQGFG